VVDIRAETLIDPMQQAPLPTADLDGRFRTFPWGSRRSGIRIPEKLVSRLLRDWLRHLQAAPDSDEEAFPEGRLVYRLHRNRERNRRLVERAKAAAQRRDGGLACAVCMFDFAAAYGPLGEGFIECHHTLPLSDVRRPRRTRVEDLALVCSNCHRMLHRKRPWLGMQELRRLLAR
jgi:5-methylcytosine-specific restriction protein A